jgi:hypothetical protein
MESLDFGDVMIIAMMEQRLYAWIGTSAASPALPAWNP